MTRNTILSLVVTMACFQGCSKSSPPQKIANPAPAAANSVPATPLSMPVAPEAPLPAARTDSSKSVQAEMHNVQFHFTDTAFARIDTLSGELMPTGKYEMPVFDDKRSFEVRVRDARIAITPKALAEIMNKFVFAKPDAPLKEVTVSIENDKLAIRGKLNGERMIPFQTVGRLGATPDGRISVHTVKMKALHVPVKGMMDLFGIDLEKVLNTSKIEGLEVDKDDLLMDLGKLLPPPHMIGKVTAARLENGTIVTIIGNPGKAATASASLPTAQEKTNYMAFKGNRVRFGKLLMEDCDLTILDIDPGGPLDWNQDKYKEQLVAGYSKLEPNLALRAYVKDFSKLPRSSAALAAQSAATVPKN